MKYNELQKLVMALDYIEDVFFCEEDGYDVWVEKKNKEFNIDKYPFILENDINSIRDVLENALKQIKKLDINVCTEEELERLENEI